MATAQMSPQTVITPSLLVEDTPPATAADTNALVEILNRAGLAAIPAASPSAEHADKTALRVVAPPGYAREPRRLALIGCGFDGSPGSREALEWAASAALATGARLRVIGVHQPYLAARARLAMGLEPGALNSVLREQYAERLTNAVEELNLRLETEIELTDGQAADGLVDASGDLDILAIGASGSPFGKNARRVTRGARCPVVVVPI